MRSVEADRERVVRRELIEGVDEVVTDAEQAVDPPLLIGPVPVVRIGGIQFGNPLEALG